MGDWAIPCEVPDCGAPGSIVGSDGRVLCRDCADYLEGSVAGAGFWDWVRREILRRSR